MYWDGIAGYLSSDKGPYFYKMDAFDLIVAYVKFNPHAQFGFVKTGENIECEDRPTNPSWCKWTPNDSTSPHWYTYDKLRGLIAAYVGSEQYGEWVLTVREFVSQFRGLSFTAKQKAVVDSLGLSGAYLHDLVDGGDIDRQQAELLLDAMCSESREVKPDLLGIIGEDISARLLGFCDAHTIKYKLVKDWLAVCRMCWRWRLASIIMSIKIVGVISCRVELVACAANAYGGVRAGFGRNAR